MTIATKDLQAMTFQTAYEAKAFIEDNQILHARVIFDEEGKYWRIKKDYRVPKYERKIQVARKVWTLEQKDAIRAAKELVYPRSVIRAIENTTNEREISNILTDARHGIFPKEEKK